MMLHTIQNMDISLKNHSLDVDVLVGRDDGLGSQWMGVARVIRRK